MESRLADRRRATIKVRLAKRVIWEYGRLALLWPLGLPQTPLCNSTKWGNSRMESLGPGELKHGITQALFLFSQLKKN